MTIRSSMSDGARTRSRRVLYRLTATVSVVAMSAYFAAYIQIAGAQPLAGVKLAQFVPGGPQVPGTNPVPGTNGRTIERGKLPDQKLPDARFPNGPDNFDKLKGAQTPKEYDEYEKRLEEERNRNDEIQRQLSGQRPPLDDVPGFDPNLRTREREVGGSPDPLDPVFQNDKGPGTVPARGPGQPNRGNGAVIVRDGGTRNACGPADVATADEFIRDLATAARAAGYAPGTVPPNSADANAQRAFEVAIGQEDVIQGRLIRELALTQGNVARNINAYLAAAAACRSATPTSRPPRRTCRACWRSGPRRVKSTRRPISRLRWPISA